MFTGIITDIGRIESIEERGDLRVRIVTRYPAETIALGASIACDGICLTVVDMGPYGEGAMVRRRSFGGDRSPRQTSVAARTRGNRVLR